VSVVENADEGENWGYRVAGSGGRRDIVRSFHRQIKDASVQVAEKTKTLKDHSAALESIAGEEEFSKPNCQRKGKEKEWSSHRQV